MVIFWSSFAINIFVSILFVQKQCQQRKHIVMKSWPKPNQESGE